MNDIIWILFYLLMGSSIIYLLLAHILVFSTKLKEPSGDLENLQFTDLRTERTTLPPLEQFKARDGEALSFRHYTANANQVLILVHGSGYHGSYFQPLASYLTEGGIASVYTLDLRGHGLHPESRGDIKYMGQIEDDLYDFIEFVKQRHRKESIILGGHSSGGGTVIRMAGGRRRHQAISGYLLIAPYIHHQSPTNTKINNWVNVNIPRIIGLSMLNQLKITHLNHMPVISFNMPYPYRDNTETLTYSYRLQVSMHPRKHYKRDILSLDQRVLVIAGSGDEAFNVDRYKQVFQDNKHAEVVLLEGLSHFNIISRQASHEKISEWIVSNN